MRSIVVALHGILTNQTDPSWPDKLDAWLYQRDPQIKVLKKEYRAGPWPRWNCWVKDPLLARSLVNELALLLRPSGSQPSTLNSQPFVWFVSHSNGAVIALLTVQRLIQRGYNIGGLILIGAAVEADLAKNPILQWCREGRLGAAIAYSSADDQVLAGDPRVPGKGNWLSQCRDWLWGKLLWPYGCLGRTGWLLHGRPLEEEKEGQGTAPIFTRWFPGGHSGYFRPENIQATFEQIHQDIRETETGSLPATSDPQIQYRNASAPTKAPEDWRAPRRWRDYREFRQTARLWSAAALRRFSNAGKICSDLATLAPMRKRQGAGALHDAGAKIGSADENP